LISIYYGVYEDDVFDLRKDFTYRERLLKNKLCGEGQNIRSLIIEKMSLQIKVIEIIKQESFNKKRFLFLGIGNE
jgi:hypothetical protein